MHLQDAAEKSIAETRIRARSAALPERMVASALNRAGLGHI
ncbi:MAG TPA: hypothetical protein VF913_21030 [Xanthobacteraceae bacterium]